MSSAVLNSPWPAQSGSYQLIKSGYARWDAQAAATSTLYENGVGSFGTAASGKAAAYIDPADYAVPNLKTLFRLRLIVLTNDTAPTCNFSASLAPVSGNPSGGAAAVQISAGSDVTGSLLTVTAPALDTKNIQTSSDFVIPTADYYSLKNVISANMAASSSVIVRIELHVHNV